MSRIVRYFIIILIPKCGIEDRMFPFLASLSVYKRTFNFINVLRARFLYKSLFYAQRLALNEFSYKKCACKMLMKLTLQSTNYIRRGDQKIKFDCIVILSLLSQPNLTTISSLSTFLTLFVQISFRILKMYIFFQKPFVIRPKNSILETTLQKIGLDGKV